MCVCAVYISYVYITTHTCSVNIKKYICYVYILTKLIYNMNYLNTNKDMEINFNIFKIYTACVCIYIYIRNIHRTHANKTFILHAINNLTALIYIYTHINY